jgi:ankyrin repeat protein
LIFNLLLSCNDFDVNITNRDGDTALMDAVNKGHVDIAKLLLCRNDIDVNICNCARYTALTLAINKGHVDIANLLLSRNDIDVNITSSTDGNTALIWAINKDDI